MPYRSAASAERRIFAQSSPASVHCKYSIRAGQCHLISSEFQTFYRREVITIQYGVSCWVSSFQQVFLPVSRFKESLFVKLLKALEIVVVDFRMPTNKSSADTLRMWCDVLWLTHWHTFDVWETSFPVKINAPVYITHPYKTDPAGRSGLSRGSAVARLLGLRVRIPPGAWMSISCECCLLSGRCLCVWTITRPAEESYRVWS